MNIPEVLLSKSDKELQQLLPEVDTIFKANYFLEDNTIYKNLGKIGNRIAIQHIKHDTIDTYRADNILDYFKPLTYNKLINLKSSDTSLQGKLNKLSNKAFWNFLYKKAIDVYGEEYVDTNGSGTIMIHFPKITIKNSLDMEHTIRDLYIKLVFSSYALNNMYAARNTYTISEIDNNYLFSHLNNSDIQSWHRNFCFGSGNFRTIYNNLRASRYETFKNFDLFLVGLKEYLNWESLEGTPYKYISKLNESSNLISAYPQIKKETLNKYYKICIENMENFEYDFQLNNGETTLKLKSSTKSKIDELLTSKAEEKEKFIIYNDQNYAYEPINTEDFISQWRDKDTAIFFKGEIKKINVIQEEVKKEKDYEKAIDRGILNYVINNIEKKLSDFIINKKLSA